MNSTNVSGVEKIFEEFTKDIDFKELDALHSKHVAKMVFLQCAEPMKSRIDRMEEALKKIIANVGYDTAPDMAEIAKSALTPDSQEGK